MSIIPFGASVLVCCAKHPLYDKPANLLRFGSNPSTPPRGPTTRRAAWTGRHDKDTALTYANAAEMTQVDSAQIRCMEVWGGTGTTKYHFARPGMDVWIWSESRGCAEMDGGDLHLLSSCASGRITRTLLADICGYGPVMAEIGVELSELMKRNVNTIQHARFVRLMSRRLQDVSRRGGCASTLTSTYFAPTRSLTLCNAGHPPPLLFRNDSQSWSLLRQAPSNACVGDVPDGVVAPSEYQQFEIKLGVGDIVLGYSNVLAESRRSDGHILGVAGLLDQVRLLDPSQPAELVANLVSDIQDQHAGNLVTDDITMLLCHVTRTPVAWRDNLLAPLRLLFPVRDRTRFE